MKKALTLVLAILMVLTMVPALAEEEKPVLVVTMRQNSLVTDYENNDFTQWVEEQLDCELDFLILPASDTTTRINMMVQNNEYMGDVWLCGESLAVMQRYADLGAIQPLNEFYEKYDTNLEARGAEMERDLIAECTSADGNIYTYPKFIFSISNEHPYRAFINQTWLDNLGLKMPTTTEELYTVLKAFKEQDANGNGDPNDEIPALGCIPAFGANPEHFLMNPFFQYQQNGYLLEDGKLSLICMDEDYREALRYMQRLVTEGLLSQETWTLTTGQYNSRLTGDEVKVGMVFTAVASNFGATNPNLSQYKSVPVLAGPKGERHITYVPTLPVNDWVMPTSCKNPELAFKFMDLMFTREVYFRSRYGVEGRDWEVTPFEGNEKAYEVMGFDVLTREIHSMWTTPGNESWKYNLGFNTVEHNCLWNGDENWFNYQRWLSIQDELPLIPKTGEYVLRLVQTPEEIEEFADITTVTNQTASEFKTNAIFGRVNLDEDWDAYIKLMKDMGIEKKVEMLQEAYDRTIGLK